MSKWVIQLKGGLYKQWKTMIHSPVGLICKILGPSLGVFIALVIFWIFNGTNDITHPNTIYSSDVALCNNIVRGQPDEEKCIDIMYSPDNSFVRQIIQYIGEKHLPDLLDTSKSVLVGQAESSDIYDFLLETDTRVMNAFSFSTLPSCKDLELKLFYNQTTAAFSFTTVDWSNTFGLYVFEAITSLCSEEWQKTSSDKLLLMEEPSMKLDIIDPESVLTARKKILEDEVSPVDVSLHFDRKTYPVIYSQPADIFYNIMLEILVYLTSLVPMCILVVEIVSEKEIGIRQIMYQSGLSESADILSWLIPAFVISFISSIIMWVFGVLCDFALFKYMEFSVAVVFYTLSIFTNVCFFMMISTFFKTIRSSVIGMIMSMALSLLFEALMSIYCIYVPELKVSRWYGYIAYVVLILLPIYPYSVVLFTIGLHAQRTIIDGELVEPSLYTWENMTRQWDACAALACDLFVPFNVMMIFLGQCVLYVFLTWYFSFVIGKGHGRKMNALFFLNPHFWVNKKYKIQKDPHNPVPTNTGKGTPNPYIKQNIRTGFEDEQKNINKDAYPGVMGSAVTINGLGKTYWKTGRPPFTAVRSLYLTIPEYTCFCLLGRNGAGKSTTIGMLIGNLKITRGNALLDGWDLKKESEHIRELVGICPQFSIFFPKLTILEHMKYFCMLRGIDCTAWGDLTYEKEKTKQRCCCSCKKRKTQQEKNLLESSSDEFNEDIDTQIANSLDSQEVVFLDDKQTETLNPIGQLLYSVGLLEYAHKMSSHLSGGMQRRLTVCLTLIGNPSLVFMDEPTTGLDPINAREIIRLVSERREGAKDENEEEAPAPQFGSDKLKKASQSTAKPSTVILTTHSMSECELLSDSVAIIDQGSTLCCGETVKLKKKYGSGYRLNIVLDTMYSETLINISSPSELNQPKADGVDNSSHQDADALETNIDTLINNCKRLCPSAVVVSKFPTIDFIIPESEESQRALPRLLQYMEYLCPIGKTDGTPSAGTITISDNDYAHIEGVKTWMIRNSQFQDVFLAMVSGKWEGIK